MKKLIVIIPSYNEAERIQTVIQQIQQLQTPLQALGVALFINVINDGSQDNTAALAQAAGIHQLINHKVNLGLGAAVRNGLLAARKDQADIVVKIDADLQHDPQDILALIQPILDDQADIVYGHRFDRIDYKMPAIRKVGNWAFTLMMRKLTKWPLKDSQPGIFAVNQDYLQVFHLPGDYNYTQQVLLDSYHKGMRFTHVDVAFKRRETGRSFISLKYPFKVLPQLLWVTVSIKPLNIFMPLALIFLLGGALLFGIECTEWLIGVTHKPIIHVNLLLGLFFFGLQTFFFGLLAELIVRTTKKS